MIALGQAALLVLPILAAWSLLAGGLGHLTNSPALARSAGRGLIASAVLALASSAALLLAFLKNDFRLEYVADYSSREQPLIYKLSAFWGGQDGSLLLWAAVLAVFGALVVLTTARRTPPSWHAAIYAVLGGILLFFAVLTAFVANPFTLLPPGAVPPNGRGLNPLLQNPWMLIHPPTLYLGYVGCALPFAFAAAALLRGAADDTWVKLCRAWSLFTFTFLSIGIWLGAYWAYIELGWGGFWAWDPVENASLMPWLTLTAFLHAGVAQEAKGTFRILSITLVTLTFLLSVYGTFLTRSGIIASVHAFGKSSIGTWFLVFLLTVTALCVGLLIWRSRSLRRGSPLESLWSREGGLLLGNLLLLGLTVIVFFMTMYPVFTGAQGGEQQSLKPEQFTAATRPWLLLLLLIMGTGPVLAWREERPLAVLRRLALPLGLGLAAAALFALLGAREIWSLGFFAVSLFVAAAIVCSFVRDLADRRKTTREHPLAAAGRLFLHHRRRYGAQLVHLSMVVMAIGISGLAYKTDLTFETVSQGQKMEVAGYRLTYEGYDVINRPEYDALALRLAVYPPGSREGVLMSPERRVYGRAEQEQPATEVAILPRVLPFSWGQPGRHMEDLYVIPLNIDLATGTATLQVLVHPLVNWLWVGGVLLILGAHLAVWPPRKSTALPRPAGGFALEGR